MQKVQLLWNWSLSLSEKTRAAVYFLALTIFLLIINLAYADRTIMYDAADYYFAMTGLFNVNGHFSLFNFSSPLRGYIFPLLLEIPLTLSKISGLDSLLVFRAFAAVFNSLMLALVFPLFFEKLFHYRARLWQSALFVLLMELFWHGHLSLPMSDFPALSFMISALLIYLLLFDPQADDRPFRWKMLLSFLLGVSLAVTVLTRPAYRFSFFLMLGLILFRLVRGPFVLRQKLGLCSLLAVGIIIIFIPQTVINGIHFQRWTPFQMDQFQGVDLTKFQLYRGLKDQRMDIGSLHKGIERRVIGFPDEQGRQLLEKENITGLDGSFSLRRYIKLIIHSPFDVAAIYARHLFDGLDIVYPSQFNYYLYTHQIRYRLLNYSLWFLAIWLIYQWRGRLQAYWEQIVLLGILVLPSLVAVPGTIETRFFMPVFIILYAAISYWFCGDAHHWRKIASIRTLCLYIAFVAACFSFSASIFAGAGILMNW